MATIAAAAQAAGDAKFGYLWQGKQAEVLVCDAVEVITSNNGAILAADGLSARINEPEAVAAIKFLYDTINTTKISPQNVLSWDEEPSRQPFTSGEAMFMRNWSYVYPIAQDPAASQVVDKVGVAPLPHFPGGKSAATLGGYQLGVNANSKQREAAVEFLTWLSSPEIQQRIALNFGLAPTRPALFEDAQIKAEQPFMASLQSVFTGATPRPITPKYAEVSLALAVGHLQGAGVGRRPGRHGRDRRRDQRHRRLSRWPRRRPSRPPAGRNEARGRSPAPSDPGCCCCPRSWRSPRSRSTRS